MTLWGTKNQRHGKMASLSSSPRSSSSFAVVPFLRGACIPAYHSQPILPTFLDAVVLVVIILRILLKYPLSPEP